MVASAVNVNAIVDNFDRIFSYVPDQAPWTTPVTWSADVDLGTTPWWLGDVLQNGAGRCVRQSQLYWCICLVAKRAVADSHQGPALYIYGFSGPDYGSFEVAIDDEKTTLSAYAAENGTTPHLLYKSDTLAYTTHTLTLTNKGALGGDAGGNAFLLDYLDLTVQMAPAECVSLPI